MATRGMIGSGGTSRRPARADDKRKGPRPVVVEVYVQTPRVVTAKAKPKRYRWRLLAGNGANIANGSEAYNRERDAVRAAKKAVRLLRGDIVLTCSRRGFPVREAPIYKAATKWKRVERVW